MRVRDLINMLLDYNLDAKVKVIAHNKDYLFSLCHGRCEGASEKEASEVYFYVDALCQDETEGE